MKKFFLFVCLISFVAPAFSGSYVKGYYRKDGTYVSSHYRQDSYRKTLKKYGVSKCNPYTKTSSKKNKKL